MRIDFSSAVSLLKNAENVLVLTHRNPDGDTLGSGYAMVRALQKMGKRARLLNGDKIPSKYSYLCENLKEESFEPEFILSVDVAEKRLLGDELSALYGERVNLSLDHHGVTKLFAGKTYSEPESASASEIIYLVIKALGVEIDPEIASAVYTGVTTDTGCFKYSSVTRRTHEIAAELIAAGADYSRINTRMFETKSMNEIMLQTLCLESLKTYAEGKVAVITVTQDMLKKTGTDKAALDAIKPLTRQIEGVKVGITVKEEESGKIGVSIRTDEDVDAALICAHFDGGGHKRAAGCELSGDIETAREKVVDYILNEII